MTQEYSFSKVTLDDDVGELAHLIFCADPFIYRDTFGTEGNAAKLLRNLLVARNNVFSMENYYTMKADGCIVGLAALYKNSPGWDSALVKEAFYCNGIPIPKSFEGASGYFDSVFNYPKVGVNTCNVVVHEGYRMKGIGDRMMEALIRISGHSPLELSVLADNKAAIHLYKKHGFSVIEEYMDYGGYGNPPVKCLRMFMNK